MPCCFCKRLKPLKGAMYICIIHNTQIYYMYIYKTNKFVYIITLLTIILWYRQDLNLHSQRRRFYRPVISTHLPSVPFGGEWRTRTLKSVFADTVFKTVAVNQLRFNSPFSGGQGNWTPTAVTRNTLAMCPYKPILGYPPNKYYNKIWTYNPWFLYCSVRKST